MTVRNLLPSLWFCALLATSSLVAGDWPQWRGPDGDGLSKETGLLKEWMADGPPVVWQIENAGVGYSSLAIADGRIITMGDLEGVEHVLAFSEENGELLWATQPEPVAAKLDGRVDEEFTRFDKNQDGKLDEQEALAGLGSRAFEADSANEGDVGAIAKARAASFLAAYDEDGDGKLGFREIPTALGRETSKIDQPTTNRKEVPAIAEARTQLTIKTFDQDGDGKISQKEVGNSVVRGFFRDVDVKLEGERRGDGQLTAEEMQNYFSKRDRGRDGIIVEAELQTFFAKFHPGRDGVLNKVDLKRSIGGYRNGQGDGPRGTPTIIGDKVYTEGGNGDITCMNVTTGETIWHVNLTEDFGGNRPGWGYSESPLLVGGNVIVTPGGDGGCVVALDRETGEVRWKSNEVTERAHYSTAVASNIAGKPTIIQFARDSVFGLDQETGEFLWKYSGANNGTANCSSPIISGDHVLASSAYGTGTGMVKISTHPETGFTAEEVYFQKELQSHHGGMVKVGDYLYGFSSGSLVCLNFMTGEVAWQDRSVGKGSVVFADGMLYCFGERHEVALVEANPQEYVEKGRFRVKDLGRPSWAHPVVANGKFYLRNLHTITCYDVTAN